MFCPKIVYCPFFYGFLLTTELHSGCTVADKADFQANDSKMSGSEHKIFFTKQYINPRIHDGVGDSSRTTKSSMKPLWLIKRVTCPNMIIWIKKRKSVNHYNGGKDQNIL